MFGRGLAVISTAVVLVGSFQVPPSGALPEEGGRSAVHTTRTGAGAARPASDYGQLPLYFVENKGQLDPRVFYSVQGRDASVYFTSRGVTFSLVGTAKEGDDKRHVLEFVFLGANRKVRPAGLDATPAVVNYFTGPRDKWLTGLSTFSSVVYHELWPGIDLVYSGNGQRLKYTFELAPGADPNLIRMAVRGGAGARITRGGALDVTTSVGRFRDAKPYAYQESGRDQVKVPSRYRLERHTWRGSSTYELGFKFGRYDRSRPLVLDPAFLVYAGFIGGTGDERGLGIAVDGSGQAYVTGQTTSINGTFPVQAGPQLAPNGNLDAFVVKLNAAGTGVVYAGYLGGSGNDGGFDITVDAAGSAYVTGFTTSSEASFPVRGGPDLTYNGAEDTFLAKVAPSGTSLVYAGYIGGRDTDFGEGVKVDAAGNAYISGTTGSPQKTFPVTLGPDLSYNGGRFDAYVAKVNPSGTALVYAGYIGGDDVDVPVQTGKGGTTVSGGHIALDAQGNAYISGTTRSRQSTFPDGNGFDSLPGPDRSTLR